MNTFGLEVPSVPNEIVEIADEWHGGQFSALYVIASTGGLTWNPSFTRTREEAARVLAGMWGWLYIELTQINEDIPLEQSTIDLVCKISDRMDEQLEACRNES